MSEALPLLSLSEEGLPVGIVVRGSRVQSLLAGCVSLLLLTGNIVSLAVLIPSLGPRFDLSNYQQYSLNAAALLLTAAASLPVSIAARKRGKWIAVLLAAICCASLFSLAAVSQWDLIEQMFPLLFFLGLLLGCGGLSLNATLPHLSCWFSRQSQGLVIGSLFFAFAVGPPLVGAWAASFAEKFGFPLLFVCMGLQALLGCLALLIFFQDCPSAQIARQVPFATDAEVVQMAILFGQEIPPPPPLNIMDAARSGRSWALMWVAAASLSVGLSLFVTIPSIFSDPSLLHLSGVHAGWIITAVGSVIAVSCVLSGLALDRWPHIVWGFGVATWLVTIACTIVLFTCSLNLWVSIVAAVVLGVAANIANICCFRLLDSLVPSLYSETVGLIGLVGNLAGFLMPIAFPYLSDLRFAWIIMGGMAASGMLVYIALWIFVGRTTSRQPESSNLKPIIN